MQQTLMDFHSKQNSQLFCGRVIFIENCEMVHFGKLFVEQNKAKTKIRTQKREEEEKQQSRRFH